MIESLQIKTIFEFLTLYKQELSNMKVDPGLKPAVLLGLVLGTCLAILFDLFPGKPTGMKYDLMESTEEAERYVFYEKTTTTSAYNNENELVTPEFRSTQNNNSKLRRRLQKEKQTNYDKQESYNGRKELKTKFKQVQTMLGVSDEELKQKLKDAKQYDRFNGQEFSLIQRFDLFVLFILIGILCYILNRDSKGGLVKVLIRTFPREAEVLRLI